MFEVDEYIKSISNKSMKDLMKSKLITNMILIDPDAIIGNQVKNEYKNAITYWCCPNYGFAIELGLPYDQLRKNEYDESREGYIYLVNIENNVFKFGRAINVRKRMTGYPKGSKCLMKYYCYDMYDSEKILLNAANESNGKLYKGNEFYYFDDINEPFKVFELAVKRISCIDA